LRPEKGLPKPFSGVLASIPGRFFNGRDLLLLVQCGGGAFLSPQTPPHIE
jgi:hypothetical protein